MPSNNTHHDGIMQDPLDDFFHFETGDHLPDYYNDLEINFTDHN